MTRTDSDKTVIENYEFDRNGEKHYLELTIDYDVNIYEDKQKYGHNCSVEDDYEDCYEIDCDNIRISAKEWDEFGNYTDFEFTPEEYEQLKSELEDFVCEDYANKDNYWR